MWCKHPWLAGKLPDISAHRQNVSHVSKLLSSLTVSAHPESQIIKLVDLGLYFYNFIFFNLF